uniref:Uncharacterized protein n=1 Tax=Triticum urartu TaxID=4572 RepID=A0A8R7UTT7_TRIUA
MKYSLTILVRSQHSTHFSHLYHRLDFVSNIVAFRWRGSPSLSRWRCPWRRQGNGSPSASCCVGSSERVNKCPSR